MSKPTVTIPLELFHDIVNTLGAQPTKSEVFPVWAKLQAHMLTTIHQAVTKAQDQPVGLAPVTPPTKSKPKRVRNRAPIPAKALAQEFIKLNPTATRADVIKHLSSKGVSDPVASSTVGKLMKK